MVEKMKTFLMLLTGTIFVMSILVFTSLLYVQVWIDPTPQIIIKIWATSGITFILSVLIGIILKEI
jgi:hypothetical protein